MLVRFSNIEWDTDGQKISLPKEVTLKVGNDVDPALDGADVLSDAFGWCVFGFQFQIIEE